MVLKVWWLTVVELFVTLSSRFNDSFRLGRTMLWAGALCGLFASGCSSLLTRVGRGMGQDFANAVQNEDDPQLVREAAPAYLLMMDALLESHPRQQDLLLAAAQLNGAYAGAFVADRKRALRMSAKALGLAQTAICIAHSALCGLPKMAVSEEATQVQRLNTADLQLLMTVGSVWAGWIQLRSSDWNAIADLPRVQLLLERVVALKPGFEQGRADLYLGAIETIIPKALGGRQDEGMAYLQDALRWSQQKDLMAKVILARQVARARYDRASHDRWLHEVLAADPHAPGWTLQNCMAQDEASALLKSADDYF